jgi:hypothetical protein
VPWLFGIALIVGGGAMIWDAFKLRSSKQPGIRPA